MQQKETSVSGGKAVIIIAAIALIAAAGSIVYNVMESRTKIRIGVVDNTALLSNFADAIAARQRLDAEKARWQQNKQALEDSIKTSLESMQKGYNTASAAKKQDMEKRLQHWNTEYNRYSRAMDEMATEKETELLQPVLERLNSFIKIWATKNGYQMVVGTGTGGVILSVADRINVTAQVLEELNKYYGKPAALQPDKKQEQQKTAVTADTTAKQEQKK